MRIAVTGANGRVGSAVVRTLTGTGRYDVVPLTRRIAPYDDPAALRAALDNVDTLVFVSSDGEAARVVVHHHNVLKAALQCGSKHVVLLSGLDVDVKSPFCYAFSNAYTEDLLRTSGLPYSILRAGLFVEFFLNMIRRAGTRTGGVEDVVHLPASDASVSLIARNDVAQCLAALAVRPAENMHYDATGLEALTVESIASAARYRCVSTSLADFASGLLSLGEEPWWTYAYTSLFEAINQGRWAATSETITELIGRKPTSLAEVLEGMRVGH